MSDWVHFVAVIRLDTGVQSIEKIINKINKAPSITGSEGNAKLYFNKPSGFNLHLLHDCWHCKHEKNLYIKKISSLDCPYYNDESIYSFCHPNNYQTETIVTIVGDLRNRGILSVLKDYSSFLNFIKNNTKYNIKSEFHTNN